MNSYDSNDFPQSSLGFVCFAITALFLFIATSEMTGQQFHDQPAFSKINFYAQPHINLAPFKEEIKILPFTGTTNFREFPASELINRISVYPNPTVNYLNLDITLDAQLMIYSNSGRLIASKGVNEGLNSINVSGFDSGIYYIVVSSLDDSQTSRFIIEK